MSISTRQQDFINSLWPYAQRASSQTGVRPEIIVAQAALETGWGRSAPNNNYFGIKGSGSTQTTKEFLNGQWVTIQDSFKGYSSMADSVQGYADFINKNPRYNVMRTTGTFEGQIEALQKSGYATDPNYGGKVKSIAETVREVMGSGGIFGNSGGSNESVIDRSNNGGTTVSVIGDIQDDISNVVSKGKKALDIGRKLITGDILGAADDIMGGGSEDDENVFEKFFKWLREFFSVNTAARVVAVLVGIVLIGGAIWALVNDKGDVIVNAVTKATKEVA